MPSKAHAVQTSARASHTVEPDMFTVDQPEPVTAKAFQHEGRCVRDAHAILQQLEGHSEPLPVVVVELECGHGGLVYRVKGPLVFPRDQMIAAQAKAARCRKGALLVIDADTAGICINFSALQRIHVAEGHAQ